MKRTHPLPTAALGMALLAAPTALAQPQRAGAADAPLPLPPAAASAMTPQNRGAAEADRMHKGNGMDGGPADLLRMAQGAMRRGQTAQANELLERAETRLLRDGAARPIQGEPAHHVSEARRALMNRDRAEAMRHTNLAIATVGDDAGAAADASTGADAGGLGAQGGGRANGMGGRSGAVDLGMGALPNSGSVVVRDAGTGGTSISRAEGIVLAQSGNRGGGAGGAGGGLGSGGGGGLPPGDTLPGWSGPRGGTQGQTGGAATTAPGVPAPGGAPGSVSRGDRPSLDFSSPLSGPSTSGVTGGEPSRVGGAPPSDTSRAPGSSGIGPSGPAGLGASGPLR
jgi:hypothetical protein